MNDWNHHLAEWDQAAWALAAAALVLGNRGEHEANEEAIGLLAALGTDPREALQRNPVESARIGAQAASSLLQAVALLTDDTTDWAQMPDDILLAQGHASARGAGAFAAGISGLATMDERLHREDARMLDVGVGVGALAVAFCEVFPALTVVGIDVFPRALRLAEHTVAESTVADRVILREQDFGELSDTGAYDLAWVPAPFVPVAALEAGAARLVRALKPGGWVVLGHGKVSGKPVEDALTRLKTLAYGGTMLDDRQAEDLLTSSGFGSVGRIATPPGAPAITTAQAPA
jgi:2-polyprenyl-3-methyl-5-hydroxy-6-metoxy-1,4-benzoquinol methylase